MNVSNQKKYQTRQGYRCLSCVLEPFMESYKSSACTISRRKLTGISRNFRNTVYRFCVAMLLMMINLFRRHDGETWWERNMVCLLYVFILDLEQIEGQHIIGNLNLIMPFKEMATHYIIMFIWLTLGPRINRGCGGRGWRAIEQ